MQEKEQRLVVLAGMAGRQGLDVQKMSVKDCHREHRAIGGDMQRHLQAINSIRDNQERSSV